MPKKTTYDIKEILEVLNRTDSWRAVDRHFEKGNGVVKAWCEKNGHSIVRVIRYECIRMGT